MGAILGILLTVILLAVGYFFGKNIEQKHFAELWRKERTLSNIVAFSAKRPPENFSNTFLVKGSVVVSSDYFKQFLSAWRLFFGGRLQSYETLLERARREAIVRMKEEANWGGANAIFNVKLETAVLSEQSNNGNSGGIIGTVEILAYGTAGTLV